MPKTLRYIGADERFFEVGVTGSQQMWLRGQSGQVSDVHVPLLLATGRFELYERDQVFEAGDRVVTSSGQEVTQRNAALLSGGRYISCLPMSDNSLSRGFARDISGAGNHGYLFGVTPAVAWANAGYFTTDPTASGNGYMFIEGWRDYWRSLTQGEANQKTIIVSMVIKQALPAASSSDGFGCLAAGPYWFLRGTGAGFPGSIQTSFTGSGGSVNGGQNGAVYLDGADHTFTIALDLAAKRYYQYLDGVLVCVGAYNVSSQPNSPIQTAMVPGNMTEFAIGVNSPQLGAVAQTATAMQVRGFHLIVLDGMPLNMHEIAQRLHRTPDVALAYNDVVMPSKRIAIAWAGQSNAQGFGSTDRTMAAAGEPIFDPVWPNGSTQGKASMHTGITERLAASGVYAHMINTAVGTSGICDHWVGRLRTWASNMTLGLGSYVINGGGVWKVAAKPTGVAGTPTARTSLQFSAGTTGPTGTADVAATATTPGYTYLGAATAADVNGTIYEFGNARFDPNGFIAALVAELNKADATVFERWVAIMFGESDSAMSVTTAEYRAALASLSNRVISACGAKVLIGASNRTDPTDSAATTVIDGQLLPARLQALADPNLSGRVFAGADLASALGALPRATFGPTDRPANNTAGLFNESSVYVHMNDKAIRQASAAWASAILPSVNS